MRTLVTSQVNRRVTRQPYASAKSDAGARLSCLYGVVLNPNAAGAWAANAAADTPRGVHHSSRCLVASSVAVFEVACLPRRPGCAFLDCTCRFPPCDEEALGKI